MLRDLLRRPGTLAPLHNRRIVRLGSSLSDDDAAILEAEDAAIREADGRRLPVIDELAHAAEAIARLRERRR